MQKYSIRNKCHVNTNVETDTFVGIRCISNEISINFPLGFHMSCNEDELRKDMFLLFNCLAETTKKKESKLSQMADCFKMQGFPIASYLFLIVDFFEHGYYKEKEVHYQVSNRGKISWERTIKTQKPYLQNNEIVYLNFVTRKNPVTDNELITLIHEYCIYDSFIKLGWLFTNAMYNGIVN